MVAQFLVSLSLEKLVVDGFGGDQLERINERIFNVCGEVIV